MNQDKANKLIDSVTPEMLDKAIEKLGGMSDLDFARVQSKIDDKTALDEAGVERITIYTKNEPILLVRPIKGMFTGWQLNLFGAGCITVEKPNFVISDIAGETFRLRIATADFSYWVDMVDEKQAQDVATFLKIGIKTDC